MCGNGLVEPDNNEDCDVAEDPNLGENLECGAPDDPIRRCRYICGVTQGAPSCPIGWRCGTDGICVFASGEYREIPTPALSAPARALEIGDLDGDGRDDLIALTNTGLGYRFSNASGLSDENTDLPLDFTLDAPIRPAVVDFDNDGLSDVAAPLSTGLVVLRGSANRLLEPVQYPFLEKLRSEITLHPTELESVGGLTVQVGHEGERMCVGLFEGDQTICRANHAELTFEPGLNLADRSVTTSTNGDVFVTVVGSRRAYVATVRCCDPAPTASVTATIALSAPAGAGLMRADVDGDGRGDVLIAQGQGWLVSNRTADGYADATRHPISDQLGWPLDAGDIDGDRVADYVTSEGIFIAAPGGPERIFEAVSLGVRGRTEDFIWREAQIADVNADGRPDVVATAELATLSVLLNGGDDLFNVADIVTRGRIRELTQGDFDGDLVPDIAFAQDEFENAPEAGTTIAIVYGARSGWPTDPVSMGRVDRTSQIESINLPVSFLELADELLVGARDPDGRRSYYALRNGDPRVRRLGSILTPADVAGDDTIAAIPLLAPATETSSAGAPHLLMLRSSDTVLLRSSGGLDFEQSNMSVLDLDSLCGVSVDRRCLFGRSTQIDSLLSREAALLLDTCSGQVLVVFEAAGEYDCRAANPLPPTLQNSQVDLSEPLLVDLNRNAQPEALLVIPGNAVPADVIIGWDAGMGTFRDTTEIEVDGDVRDVIAIDVDADRDLELMLLTENDLRLGDISQQTGFVQRTDDEGQPTLVLERSFSERARLAVADFNGDGLQDVIISDDARLYTLLGTAGRPQ